MPRYVSQPKRTAYWDGDVGEVYEREVTVYDDDLPQETGLLDADGNPLYRLRDPIGFDLGQRET